MNYIEPFMIINSCNELKESSKKLKERAIQEYKTALKMPRKKKKQAKKSAQMLWNIACWDEEILY